MRGFGVMTMVGPGRLGKSTNAKKKTQLGTVPKGPPGKLPFSRRGRPFEGEAVPPDMAIKGLKKVKSKNYRKA